MKICSKCQLSKDESEFYWDKSKGGRLRSICKPCQNIYARNINKTRPPSNSPIIGFKVCSDCLQEKFYTEFYQDKKTRTGLKPNCKDCSRRISRNYSRNNIAKKREYVRKKVQDPAERERRRLYRNTQAKKFRQKHSARVQLARAVKTGKIIRLPCEVCQNPISQAHHEDYSKPLDVRWLCQTHHGIAHRRFP